MPDAAQLFDRSLVARRRERAIRQAAPGSDFLLKAVTADLMERLSAILRAFDVAVDLGGSSGHVAEALAARANVTQVVRADGLVAGPGAPRPGVVCDDEILPFRAQSLDLVVSALTLQFANDLPGVFSQIRKALRPDGLFLAAFAGGETLIELRTALAEAELELLGGISPRVVPAVSVRDAGSLLQRAGFALPVTDRDMLVVRYDDMFALIRDLRAMAATNCLVEQRRAPPPRALFLRAAQIYAERFADPDGRIRATFEIVSISGWAPHESQQKPLRPGSAKMRLADALSVPEADRWGQPGRDPSDAE